VNGLRSPLARARGHGSAKEGVSHWWAQRLTSVALVPLGCWFLISLLTLPSLDHATVVNWMSGTATALVMILFVLVAVWHSQLGIQVVIEDYVHDEGMKTVALALASFAHFALAAAALLAILRITLRGAA
jgi:succinate dehydrogenase / fumarate reductase, membrane anchor subunit